VAARYKTIDREQLRLLPYDMKEWIPENGIGEEQYHPHLVMALLLYCCSHGIFSSRRIKRVNWKDVAVRYICGSKALESHRGRDLYRQRKQSVEPVFGILKQALGFRQFLLRGPGKVNLEGQPVTRAYNLKGLAVLRTL